MRRLGTAYLFLLPYLAVFAVFWAWPIVQSILLSLQNTRGISVALPAGA